MTMVAVSPTTIRCAHCGTPFTCDPAGACWCKDEAFRLPLPADGAATCLCPACLRAAQEASRR